jgi:hypothetical protein
LPGYQFHEDYDGQMSKEPKQSLGELDTFPSWSLGTREMLELGTRLKNKD